MAKAKRSHWYDVEAEHFGDFARAEAERAYRAETGDKSWTRGFTGRFEAWLAVNAGTELTSGIGSLTAGSAR
jgi:hypothetical protein